MKKIISALALTSVMVSDLTGCAGTSGKNGNGENAAKTPAAVADKGKAPDYSRKESWLQIPEITRDVDTFYIYSTAYYESSFKEGAPDYAPLDNPEMTAGARGEYVTNASVYEKSVSGLVKSRFLLYIIL